MENKQQAKQAAQQEIQRINQKIQDIKELAERLWEKADGCNDTHKEAWVEGFIAGYIISQ